MDKMKITRKETLERMHYIDQMVSPYSSLPPEYEAIMINSDKKNDQSDQASSSEDYYDHEGKKIPKIVHKSKTIGLPNAQLLLNIEDGAQLFFIDSENNVSSPGETCGLQIFKIDEKNNNVVNDISQVPEVNLHDTPVEGDDITAKTKIEPAVRRTGTVPPTVLHIGSWIYPLFPGQSPVLKDLIGAYMFPDLTDTSGKSFVGLVLSSTIDQSLRQEFETTLSQLALFKKMDPEEYLRERSPTGRDDSNLGDLVVPKKETQYGPIIRSEKPIVEIGRGRVGPSDYGGKASEISDRYGKPVDIGIGAQTTQTGDLGDKICKNIVYGTEWVALNVQYITGKADEFIRTNSKKIQDKLEPTAEPMEIGSVYRSTAYIARKTTKLALRVTQYSVKKFGNITVSMAKFLAPYIRKSTVLIPQSLVPREKADHAIDQMLDIAEQSIIGISTVFLSLEMAGTALASSLADETVRIVQYKFGHKAGSLTQDALVAATNMAKVGYNLNSFGPKAIMFNTARKSGVAFVEGIRGSDHLVQERIEKERAIRDHFEKQKEARDRRNLVDGIKYNN
ncbi:unnamed protein product [Gordionus sp. m RMFG-2023]